MKYGRVTNVDLNNLVGFVAQALSALPERAVGFAIAPHLTSERRSGLTSELRTEPRVPGSCS